MAPTLSPASVEAMRRNPTIAQDQLVTLGAELGGTRPRATVRETEVITSQSLAAWPLRLTRESEPPERNPTTMYQVLSRVRRLPAVLAVSAVAASSVLVVAPSTAFASGLVPDHDRGTGFDHRLSRPRQAAQATLQSASAATSVWSANGSGAGLSDAAGPASVNIAASSRVLNAGNEQNNLYAWKVGGDAMVLAVKASWATANNVNSHQHESGPGHLRRRHRSGRQRCPGWLDHHQLEPGRPCVPEHADRSARPASRPRARTATC